jgi:Ca2+-binding EF-hand superfamily protein
MTSTSPSTHTGTVTDPKKREIYAACFQKYDVDGSNSMDASELQSLLTDMGWTNVTNADVQEALAVLDQDGNGTIELDEFLQWSLYAWETFVLQSPGRTKLKFKNNEEHMTSLSEMPEMEDGGDDE